MVESTQIQCHAEPSLPYHSPSSALARPIPHSIDATGQLPLTITATASLYYGMFPIPTESVHAIRVEPIQMWIAREREPHDRHCSGLPMRPGKGSVWNDESAGVIRRVERGFKVLVYTSLLIVVTSSMRSRGLSGLGCELRMVNSPYIQGEYTPIVSSTSRFSLIA